MYEYVCIYYIPCERLDDDVEICCISMERDESPVPTLFSMCIIHAHTHISTHTYVYRGERKKSRKRNKKKIKNIMKNK